jgi:hypothetical protein
MISSTYDPPSPNKTISRDLISTLISTGLAVGENRYVRKLALSWLASYPGDLAIKYQYAKALTNENQTPFYERAYKILSELCYTDPEFLEAQVLQVQVSQQLNSIDTETFIGSALVLGGASKANVGGKHKYFPKWSAKLREAQLILDRSSKYETQQLDNAEQLIHQSLLDEPETPLVATLHLKVVRKRNSLPDMAMRSLALSYQNRWPSCLQLMLILADILMDTGDTEKAVALLHESVSLDIVGQVPGRLWGDDHPYRSLWPEIIEIPPQSSSIPQNLPIPASVAVVLGWNQLPEPILSNQYMSDRIDYIESNVDTDDPEIHPQVVTQQSIDQTSETVEKTSDNDQYPQSDPETLRSVQAELERIAEQLRQPFLASVDGRLPVYVVLTTKLGLELKYGKENAGYLFEELKRLVRIIRGRHPSGELWSSVLFLPDDPQNVTSFGLEPVPHNDPWAIKLSLKDLDEVLAKRGEMIGCVLIVGGPDVVPFHNLPNPVDDFDAEVPTDNPYATRDENYFIPEWPVGRLPGDSGDDISQLINAVNNIILTYKSEVTTESWFKRFWRTIVNALTLKQFRLLPSMGYTAAIWRKASFSVYRSIGEPQAMMVSPPLQVCDPSEASKPYLDNDDNISPSYEHVCLNFPNAQLAYFNLHGIEDAVEWYGQRDPTDPGDGPDFPVALRPQDIRNGGSAPRIVFTEACYGAHIENKTINEAMALKFLNSGSHAVIGSTCISYGSISAPLIAADLLGHSFWEYITDGIPTGEAFKRAKINLARVMHKRQGYLDGEDQKTLISFVLYGDPLSQPSNGNKKTKVVQRTVDPPDEFNTVCDRIGTDDLPVTIPDDVMLQVKEVVSKYLPGMEDAELSYMNHAVDCTSICINCTSSQFCPSAKTRGKNKSGEYLNRKVVTLSQKTVQANYTHKQVAKVTMDTQGKVIKLAVSR